jgi:hypothetical protein
VVRRHPAGRRRPRPRVRPPRGRAARHARAVRGRRLGDLLDARPAGAAVQAGAAAGRRAGRRAAGAHRRRDRPRRKTVRP